MDVSPLPVLTLLRRLSTSAVTCSSFALSARFSCIREEASPAAPAQTHRQQFVEKNSHRTVHICLNECEPIQTPQTTNGRWKQRGTALVPKDYCCSGGCRQCAFWGALSVRQLQSSKRMCTAWPCALVANNTTASCLADMDGDCPAF